MADITKVRAEADKVKAELNERFKQKVDRLTSAEINDIISTLEKSGVNREQVNALKAEIAQTTDKNKVIARVISAPGALCEQVKGIINKIKR